LFATLTAPEAHLVRVVKHLNLLPMSPNTCYP
jgi:hypothetical protein